MVGFDHLPPLSPAGRPLPAPPAPRASPGHEEEQPAGLKRWRAGGIRGHFALPGAGDGGRRRPVRVPGRPVAPLPTGAGGACPPWEGGAAAALCPRAGQGLQRRGAGWSPGPGGPSRNATSRPGRKSFQSVATLGRTGKQTALRHPPQTTTPPSAPKPGKAEATTTKRPRKAPDEARHPQRKLKTKKRASRQHHQRAPRKRRGEPCPAAPAARAQRSPPRGRPQGARLPGNHPRPPPPSAGS